MNEVIIIESENRILQLAKRNNGIITSSMITEAGFSRGSLKYLVDKGKLERSARGVYILPNIWDDEFVNLQSRFAKGVFSLETALFLHDLTDRTPNYYWMTFPTGYNLTSAKIENIRCNQVTGKLFDIGIIEVFSPNGNKIRVYSMERTLCDILRPRNNVDIQIVTEAFKKYAKRNDKNIPKLSEYAKLFKVENKIRSYMEVLI